MAELTVLGQSKQFNYTGGMQSINLNPGYYKLEVWGSSSNGTYGSSNGGYSSGIYRINSNKNLYICCGGKQLNDWTDAYNGGGYCGKRAAYGSQGGGGATHIATINATIPNLSNNESSILIVAGGAGGSGKQGIGGSGGGLTGGSSNGAGATQTSGYAFGQGGRGQYKAGGGGGYYGGRESSTELGGGGGGSGYLNPILLNSSTQNGVNSNTGYAKITRIIKLYYKTLSNYITLNKTQDDLDGNITVTVNINTIITLDNNFYTYDDYEVFIKDLNKDLYTVTREDNKFYINIKDYLDSLDTFGSTIYFDINFINKKYQYQNSNYYKPINNNLNKINFLFEDKL